VRFASRGDFPGLLCLRNTVRSVLFARSLPRIIAANGFSAVALESAQISMSAVDPGLRMVHQQAQDLPPLEHCYPQPGRFSASQLICGAAEDRLLPQLQRR
jgi:hypothetical protein